MNKAKLIKALNMVIEAINDEEVAVEKPVAEEPAKVVKKTVAKKETKEVIPEPVEEESAEPVASGDVDIDSLKSMKYNEFKKYASELGVKCTGTRDEIMERILALNSDDEETTEEEEAPVEEAPKTKSVATKSSKKLGKAKVEEPTKDEFDEKAEAVAEETDVADIIEALKDIGIKATKKNAVEKLAGALREKLISLDDEEEEDEEEESEEADDTEEAEDDGEEITADTYFSQFDPEGYNDPDEMSKARAKAVKSLVAGVIEQVENGQIGEEDILSYLNDNCTDEEKDLLGDDYEDNDLIGMYIEMIKRTVDDDGEKHEPSDPYSLCGNDTCCGHELKYVKDTEKYVCEICGTEYEAE